MLEKLRNAALLVVGGVVVFWAISSLVGVVQGGPQEPPGPPGETMLPLNDVEARTPLYQADMPYTLSTSGSYYLTEDLNGSVGFNGITISVSDVTLDLNGFALIGVPGSFDGVNATDPNISVSNGTVRDWGGDGVDAYYASNSEFRDLRVQGNTFYGLRAGASSSVSGSTASGNNMGISINGGVLVDSSASVNVWQGIELADGAVASDCAVYANGGDGIYASSGSEVRNCTAARNDGDGIEADYGTLIIGNSAFNNDFDSDADGFGIHVTGDGNRIQGNNVKDNYYGIGVYQGNGNLITDNNANSNASVGIDVTIGNSNHIEGNHAVGNGAFGIFVGTTGNIIIKNTGRGNPSGAFSIVAGNTYGEIIVGAQQPIADDVSPWANFSY